MARCGRPPISGILRRPSEETPMSRTRPLVVLVLAVLVCAAAPARAADQGASSFGLSLAPGRQLDQTYTVLAGRVGYYFADDFEGSLGLEAWRGKDPSLYKVVPELRYTVPMNPRARPYGALFVSRTFYDGLPDKNTFGGRLGFAFTLNRGASLGVGIVHERIEGCDAGTYRQCRQTWPEVGLSFAY
jgi:hypothetical protein